MLFARAVIMAIGSMRSSKLRTFLTLLGIIVGVFSVVATLSIIQGLNRYVATEILATGSHSFSIMKLGFATDLDTWIEGQKRKDLTVEDADWLRDRMANAAFVVAQIGSRREIKGGRDRGRGVRVLGTDPGYQELESYPLDQGRHLVEDDVRQSRPVAVVGSRIRDEILGPGDPLGQEVRVGGHTMRVAGVLEERGSVLGVSLDDAVIVPITTYQKSFGRKESVEIKVKASTPQVFREAQDEASLLMKLRRGRKPYDDADFDVLTSELLYGFYEQVTGGLFLAMLGIVGLSLVIGGIVIMNIMLVAVAERTREIGVRRALGARSRDIILQFIVESATLSGLGGVLGVVLGVGAPLAVKTALSLPIPIQVTPVNVLGGVFLGVAVGMAFGLYPAHRASRLDPIQALRHEV